MERHAAVKRVTFDASGAAGLVQKLRSTAVASPAKVHGASDDSVARQPEGDALDSARAYCLERSALACRRLEVAGVNSPGRKRGLILFWLLVVLVVMGAAVRRHVDADARRADGPRHSLADGGLWSVEAQDQRIASAALDVLESGAAGKGEGKSRRHRLKRAAKRAARRAFRRAQSAAPAAWRAATPADGTGASTAPLPLSAVAESERARKKRKKKKKRQKKKASKEALHRAYEKAETVQHDEAVRAVHHGASAAPTPGSPPTASSAADGASAPLDLEAIAALAHELSERKALRAAEGDGADEEEPLQEEESDGADDDEWNAIINDVALSALGGADDAATGIARGLRQGGLTPWLRSIGFTATE